MGESGVWVRWGSNHISIVKEPMQKIMHTLAKVRRTIGNKWIIFASLKELPLPSAQFLITWFSDTLVFLLSVILPFKVVEIDMPLSCQRTEDLPLLRSTNSYRKTGWIQSFLGLDLHPEGWSEEESRTCWSLSKGRGGSTHANRSLGTEHWKHAKIKHEDLLWL